MSAFLHVAVVCLAVMNGVAVGINLVNGRWYLAAYNLAIGIALALMWGENRKLNRKNRNLK